MYKSQKLNFESAVLWVKLKESTVLLIGCIIAGQLKEQMYKSQKLYIESAALWAKLTASTVLLIQTVANHVLIPPPKVRPLWGGGGQIPPMPKSEWTTLWTEKMYKSQKITIESAALWTKLRGSTVLLIECSDAGQPNKQMFKSHKLNIECTALWAKLTASTDLLIECSVAGRS
jgi:hypothetical protein